jgi:cytosine/adenosine deaminase-related metal-dependent hydrolase
LILRPSGVVVGGHLQRGLELVLEGGEIVEVRPHTGLPDPWVISPAFVNAHSHLEYRGLMGKLESPEYFSWIREITEAKKSQTEAEVRQDCIQAAIENRSTGVAWIAEHSDRPLAAEALNQAGIGGIIFQELITILEKDPQLKLSEVRRKLAAQAAEYRMGQAALGLHTAYTVDMDTLRQLSQESPCSIHVAETDYENQLFLRSSGPISDFYHKVGLPITETGMGVVETLNVLGYLRHGVQFIHCCALSAEDIALIAQSGVTVAHCPRSNIRLKCPIAPVRELLDAGVPVGLGLDSAASSGPIDMFAEMRAALAASAHRGKPLLPEEVWDLATAQGFRSLPTGSAEIWDIYEGSRTTLIKINIQDAEEVDDLIQRGAPELVEWI